MSNASMPEAFTGKRGKSMKDGGSDGDSGKFRASPALRRLKHAATIPSLEKNLAQKGAARHFWPPRSHMLLISYKDST